MWIMIVNADCTVQLDLPLDNKYFDQNYKDLSVLMHPDSSDRSPSKLNSRHWQLETALSTTSLSNVS